MKSNKLGALALVGLGGAMIYAYRQSEQVTRNVEKFIADFDMFSDKDQVERLKSEQDFRKWKGSVIGGDEDIKKALASLGRQPKNAEELEGEIFKQKEKELQTALNKSKYSLW